MEPVSATEPVQVRKRNHIWANVFDDEEEDVPDKENGYERRRDDHEDVDEDEMLYVRGASPTSRRKRERDRSPHQYSFSSHGTRPRSPAGRPSSKSMKRPREEPDEQEDEGRTEGRRERKKRKKKHKRKSRERESSKTAEVICSFYMKGGCHKGSSCQYSHQATPLRRYELCKYYLMDVCSRGDKCVFMHQDFPCKFYHMGKTCITGSNCKFSHAQLSDSMRTVLLRYLQSTDDDILKKKSSFHRNQKDDVHSSHSGQEQPKYESEDSPPVMRYSREASPSSNGHHSVQDDGYAKDEGGMIPCFPQFYKDTLSAAQEEQKQQTGSALYSSEKKTHSKVVDTVSSESSQRKKPIDSSPDSGSRRKVQPYNLEKQKELYLQLQGKTKKEPEAWTSNIETKTEPEEDDNWYSSDEEDKNTVQVKQEYPSSSSAKPSSETNVNATLSKLLSAITKRSNGECSTQNNPVQDPRHKNPVPSRSSPGRPSSEPAPPPVINIYGSAIFNIPGNDGGKHTSIDSCRDKDSSGLLNLPFKPAPFHAPATEIYASETSHPPIEYHVAPVSIPTPDYRHLRFKTSDPQVHSDPRLRKLYRLVAKTNASANFRPVTQRSDPRRRNSRETAVH
ncbi:cyclin-dependent kinase 12 [Anabrus simplex]|uniref:cyclin-dependent kinase 12 n=1 Tax=Anabrus simplex TaxID=316456 RepID=UPI0035A2941B